MRIITVENVSVSFGTKTVLQGISFEIQKGDYIGLIGPNGAGKTTLIKTILGKIKSNTGNIQIQKGIKIGYVPQKYKLSQVVPLSVKEVILMGKEKNSTATLTEVLNLVELSDDFLNQNFHNLSGGQMQRVIIARALFGNPDILFFDEPLTGIDFETKLKIYELLARLNKKNELSILFVSHEVEYIVPSCHRILCLNKKLHQGCHPLDFAHGKTECPVLEVTPQVRPIHHHHRSKT
jgi:zinc transport system ATP-binding protein